MSADEYASKELQQWRKQDVKKDIEAIELHELDMLALGNTYVMKSHKGEQVISFKILLIQDLRCKCAA